METNNVRNILLRALFDSDFHSMLVSDPERAIKDYNLSKEERQILLHPTAEIYRFVNPVKDLTKFGIDGGTDGGTPPPPPTTITVIIVVAIIIFVTAIVANPGTVAAEIEKYRPIIDAIKSSKGAERFDLVRTLVNELTKGQ